MLNLKPGRTSTFEKCMKMYTDSMNVAAATVINGHANDLMKTNKTKMISTRCA